LQLAADCIYDDELSARFFDTAEKLLLGRGSADAPAPRPMRRLVMALEKRVNFELEAMAVVAHGYAYFRAQICGCTGGGECECAGRFVGRQIELDTVPQKFVYDRGSSLELWELTLK